MKNITIITSTRAEYGLLRPVIQKVAAAQDLQLQLVVTGAHLCARFGNTVQEIEADSLPIAARLPIFEEENPNEPVALTIARTITVFDGYFAGYLTYPSNAAFCRPPPGCGAASGRPL